MSISRNIRKDAVHIRKTLIYEDDFIDLIAYLKHRIHKPVYNVFTQYRKRCSGKEYNWWKENQLLI